VYIISDTNILSSLAAGESLDLLPRLFIDPTICIPPAVHKELLIALERGKAYLAPVLESIAANEIQTLELSEHEQLVARELPLKLNDGEREAIAVCQTRKLLLLSNDKRAVRYCTAHNINVADLLILLRSLWIHRIISRNAIESLIEQMELIEHLVLTQPQRATIFAPRRRKQ